MTPRALERLLQAALPVLLARRRERQARHPGRQRAVGGGWKRRLGPRREVLMELIYLRHNVSHEVVGALGTAGMRVPHKKPKGGTLTDAQREVNRRHAPVRVRPEHGVRRLKAFRILPEDYRLALGLFPCIASAVIGLVHLVRLAG